MKLKVRRWQGPAKSTYALDAWFLWMIGRMPGECFERIALKHGREHWLYRPSHHGEHCPSSGDRPGIECRCDECPYYLKCFPDWESFSV